MRKFVSFFLILCLLLLSPCAFAAEEAGDAPANSNAGLDMKTKACILLEGTTGTVLYEENADTKLYPASVTKIMTLVLALEAVEKGTVSLDDTVTTSEYAASMGGSQVFLYPGETRTLHEMLIAIAVGSGNDASVAVAEYIGGSVDNFVAMMNQRAKELGMNNTHFANPHGLHDENHYTTARDLSLLARHALTVPKLLDYTSIYEYDFRPEPNPLKLWSTNRLLKWYDGVDGMKTGYTPEAGRNLVATAQRDDLRLIAIVLGVKEAQGHFTEAMKLLNYGFNQFAFTPIIEKGAVVGECSVLKGVADKVNLVAGEKLGSVHKKTDKGEITTEMQAEKELVAPLKAGDKAGIAIIYQNGQEVGRIDLLVAEDVAKGSWLREWKTMLCYTLFHYTA